MFDKYFNNLGSEINSSHPLRHLGTKDFVGSEVFILVVTYYYIIHITRNTCKYNLIFRKVLYNLHVSKRMGYTLISINDK